MISTELRQVGYHHPDAQLLIDEVQQEYVRRYGGPDDTPMDRDEFSPPNGHFVVLYEAGRPVAMGGWRFSQEARAELGQHDLVAELKRMYVIPAGRGRGHARSVLAHLELTAAAAGARRMVLETGAPQPEAVALYRSSGYAAIPRSATTPTARIRFTSGSGSRPTGDGRSTRIRLRVRNRELLGAT